MRLSLLKTMLATLLIAAFASLGTAAAAPSSGLDTGAGPWQWVRPPVQGSVVEAVSFISASTGWAVGLDGLVLKTTNSGVTWTTQYSGTTYNLTGVKFVDANNGWAVGIDGYSSANVIVHTTDGGATWSVQTPPAGCSAGCNNIHLSGVSFASTTRGVIVSDGYVFYTINGGTSWALGSGVTSSNVLTAVQMIDTNNAWAVGNTGVIYKSINGGQMWSSVASTTTTNLTGVYFTDTTHGMAVGSTGLAGKLLRYNGTSWVASTTTTASPLMGVTVPGTAPGSTLIAVGLNGAIYKNSTNIWAALIDDVVSGMNAAPPASGTTGDLICVTAPSGSAVYAGGEAGGITASIDTGSTWNLKAGGSSSHNMTASSFISGTDEGWMAGDNGTVVHTADGGANWNDDNSGIPTDAEIHGIHFINATTGFAVGCQGSGCPDTGTGVAYKYSGSGGVGVWTTMNPPTLTNIALNSVHMTSADDGWAVGAGGTVLRTSNASTGADWVSTNTGVAGTVEFNSVDATDATSDGWAVGQDSVGAGVVYTYSGAAWSTLAIPGTPPAFLVSIDMIDASTTGYMVGSGGVIYKTTNGTDWLAQTSGTSKLLASVSFIPNNANIGFAVGEFGRVIHTRNGGATWSAENLGTNLNMLTVSTVDERTAFTGGNSGSALRSLRPYYFTWYDDAGANNWVLMANPNGAASDLWFNLYIAGNQRAIPGLSGTDCPGGPYAAGQVPAGCTAVGKYNGVWGGPVNAASMTSDKAIVSQRILWPKGGSSLEEVLGQDIEKLSDHFYWTWYDQNSAGYKNWVLVANPNPFPIYYDLWIGGTLRKSVQVINAGANDVPQFAGSIGGPVEVKAYNTSGRAAPAFVMASQRVLMNNDTAFNEVPGIPAGELSSDYLWTWYDASPGVRDWVLIANPPGDTATSIYYKVIIAGAEKNDGSAPAGSTCKGPILDNANRTPEFPVYGEGPVEVKTYSDSGCTTTPANSIASQRITWNNGLSFEEVPGYPRASLTNTYHWTWFDQSSPGMTNWVLVANPDASIPIYYEITIAGTLVSSGDILPLQNVTPTFAGQIGGPVKVQAWTNSGKGTEANAMASQRVLYNGYFNEVLGTVLN